MSTETDTTKPPLDLDAIEARARRVYPERGWDGDEAARARATVIEDVPALVAAVRERDAELARLTRERDALREIVEGRTVPPTLAEALAHDGAWMAGGERVAIRRVRGPHGDSLRAYPAVGAASIGDAATRAWLPTQGGRRWIPLDREDRPCAWPTVTP